jgi:hypothetical protein
MATLQVECSVTKPNNEKYYQADIFKLMDDDHNDNNIKMLIHFNSTHTSF